MTSVRSWSTSVLSCGGGGPYTVEIDGEATSMILSASWDSSSRLVVLEVEARIIWTLLGSRCKKSSRWKVLSVVLVRPPRSCWILRRSCVGFLSPNSSALKSCCNLRCSEAGYI